MGLKQTYYVLKTYWNIVIEKANALGRSERMDYVLACQKTFDSAPHALGRGEWVDYVLDRQVTFDTAPHGGLVEGK